MTAEFLPTHEIQHNDATIRVLWDPDGDGPVLYHLRPSGVLYTLLEWTTHGQADWSYCSERGLLFQGRVPIGTSSIRPLERSDYVAAAHIRGLDADEFEAAACRDVLRGHLELPRAAQPVPNACDLAVTPSAYWGWLIHLVDKGEDGECPDEPIA